MPLHEINVNLKDTIVGSVNGKRNLLTGNFWAIIFGYLLDANVGPVYDVNNTAFTIRTSGEANDVFFGSYSSYSGWIRFGSGTPTQPTLRDYNISTTAEDYVIKATTEVILSNGRRITMKTTPISDKTEAGLMFKAFDTGGGSRSVLLGRVVKSIKANYEFYYNIDFLIPWTRNMALMFFSIIVNNDTIPVTDINGTSRFLRGSGDLNAGPVRIVISPSQITWSPTIYTIPGMVEVTMTNRVFYRGDYHVYLVLVGKYTPSSDMTVNTIGLVQKLYDSSGNTFDSLLFAMPLSNPITLQANRENIIMLRLLVA